MRLTYSQARKLDDDVKIHLIRLGKTTTKEAKRVEKSILKKIFKRTGKVPEGNKRSFKPKNKK